MRRLAAFAAAALALALTAGAAALARDRPDRAVTLVHETACGTERWPEKTLADPFASKVKLTPHAATVDGLRTLTKVVGIGGQRGLGVERTTYRVHVKLVGIKQEADSDFHLVIADPTSGKTMIAEFPDPSCTLGAKATLRTKMQTARIAVVTACGFAPNSGYHHISGTATITGVGFFDFSHHQTGRAPNDIELHPVLKFSGRCS
ncbi:MAG: hypothetical protein ACYDA3_01535 [Gaiellaceae bacterium]